MNSFVNELNKFLKINSFYNLKNNLNIISLINIDYHKYLTNSTGYQKKLLYENDIYDVYLIIWYPNCVTKIHNHADNGCYMKLLSGRLTEYIYESNNLNITKINDINKNDFTYIDNKIGCHKILNSDQISTSIHIYSPPRYQTKYF